MADTHFCDKRLRMLGPMVATELVRQAPDCADGESADGVRFLIWRISRALVT